jgi:hypothetical protein
MQLSEVSEETCDISEATPSISSAGVKTTVMD